jgi:type IV pilus assembly protein PilV
MLRDDSMAFSIFPAAGLPATARKRGEAGFTLLEVLVSLVIILLGLLGLAGLVIRSNQTEMESYQRVQAVALVQDMADRINSNRKVAQCYSNGTTGITLGTGASAPATCTAGDAQQNARANADLATWNILLLGSAETSTTGVDCTATPASCVGAMIGARACVNYDATTEVAGLAGTGVYTVSVVWQGLALTAASDNTCFKTALPYGDDKLRRVVTSTVRIAWLSI